MSEVVLPEGWASINLERIANIILGQSPDGESVNELGQGIIFFQGKTEFGKIYPTPRKFCTSPKKIAEAGDILLSVRAPVGPTNFASQRCAIGRGLSAIRGFNGIDQFYLMYFFKSIEMWLSEQGTGTTFKAISGDFIREINVCIPPLAEQKVIADKLDSLLAQVDNIKNRLDALPTIIKRFKQSVLSAAVSGKLTEDFSQENYKRNKGKLSDFTSIDIGHAFKSAEFTDSGVRLLRGQNIEPSSLRWIETKYFPRERLLDLEHLFINEGDIILAMDRPIISSGLKLARARKIDLPCVLVQRVARFKNFQNIIPDFLYLLLSSVDFTNYIQPNQTGSDIPHISGKQILDYSVSLPPLEEQIEIVRRVEQLFAYADQIEQQVKTAQSRVNNLTQSVLAKAFRGELTADWRAANPDLISGENSAQALLAKIKAERDKPKKISKQQAMFNE